MFELGLWACFINVSVGKKVHIGKSCDKYKCQELKVDKWEELEVRNEETGIDAKKMQRMT